VGIAIFAPHWKRAQRTAFIKNKATVDTIKNIKKIIYIYYALSEYIYSGVF
jgi:hypothetical protein